MHTQGQYTALILGSASPYKKKILEDAGFVFTIESADIDELTGHKATAEETVKDLSERKAVEIMARHKEEDVTVITTDVDCEIVIQGNPTGKIIGKAKTLQEAEDMIMSYSGNTVYIWCATTIATPSSIITDVRKADVLFAKLHRDDVHAYVQEKQPLDKGGAIAIEEIQERGFVESIDGDMDVIIGISLAFIKQALQ